MAAATRDLSVNRRTPLSSPSYGFDVKGGTRIFGRSIVGLTATKLAVPAGTAGCVALVGLAAGAVDNRDGADGDRKVRADKGVFNMPLPAAIVADIGKVVYAIDDQTLQLTNAGGALALGVIDAIDAEGVWVRI